MLIDTKRRWLQLAAILALIGSLSSCKKSYRAVVEERADRIDAFAAELQALKGTLPPVSQGPPEFVPIHASESELPYFHIKDDDSNTAVIMTDVMDDIRAVKPEFEGDYFDFPGTALNTLQKMAHPEKGRDDGWFANRVDRLLECRYLLVLDLKEEQPIEFVDEKNFSGGVIQMNGHFYDRGTEQWLGSFPIVAVPEVGYAFGEKNQLQSIMERDIKRNAREAACEQLDQILESGVGGLFEFDYDGPGKNGEPVPYAWE